MSRSVAVVVAVALVVGITAGPAVALVQSGAPSTDGAVKNQAGNAGNATNVTPGERLSGVVVVTEAEVDGEISERSFGVRVANAATNETKADVVADQLDDIESRLAELQDRKDRLEAARENGTISEGTYRAEMASTVARIHTVKRLANASERTAGSLPADVLEKRGINTTAIQTLKHRADEMTGPEVAEVARSIAGPDVGKGVAGGGAPGNAPEQAGPPGDRGPGNAGNESERGPPDDTGPDDSDGNGEEAGDRGGGQTTAEEADSGDRSDNRGGNGEQ